MFDLVDKVIILTGILWYYNANYYGRLNLLYPQKRTVHYFIEINLKETAIVIIFKAKNA